MTDADTEIAWPCVVHCAHAVQREKENKSTPRGPGESAQPSGAKDAAAASAQQGPGWSGNAAQLAEQRDGILHSSQQKIKVVIDR